MVLNTHFHKNIRSTTLVTSVNSNNVSVLSPANERAFGYWDFVKYIDCMGVDT